MNVAKITCTQVPVSLFFLTIDRDKTLSSVRGPALFKGSLYRSYVTMRIRMGDKTLPFLTKVKAVTD